MAERRTLRTTPISFPVRIRSSTPKATGYDLRIKIVGVKSERNARLIDWTADGRKHFWFSDWRDVVHATSDST